MPTFKKILSRKKWRPFLIFEFFAKIAKHKNAYISKTVLDRAILTKFLSHRVSLQSSHANFQKNFILPKMAAILNFRIFAQKLQNTKMLISRKPCYIERFRRNFLIYRVSLQSSHVNFQKNFVSQKMAAIFNFRIFRKNCKT